MVEIYGLTDLYKPAWMAGLDKLVDPGWLAWMTGWMEWGLAYLVELARMDKLVDLAGMDKLTMWSGYLE